MAEDHATARQNILATTTEYLKMQVAKTNITCVKILDSTTLK